MSLLHLPKNRRTRTLVVLVWATATSLLGMTWWVADASTAAVVERAPIFAVFSVLLIFLETRPIATQSSTRIVTFSWTIGFTLLLIVSIHFALSALAVASAVGWYLNRNQAAPLGVATGFEAASTTISLYAAYRAGSLVADLTSVSSGTDPDLRWLGAVLIAQVTGVVVSASIDGMVRSVDERSSVVRSIVARGSEQLRTDGLFFGLSPVFAVVASSSVILLPILLFTMWSLLHSASSAIASQKAAAVDEMTGIPNRRLFDHEGARMLEAVADRNGRAALIHMDLDGFKGINDRLGHQYGDGVLKEIALRLDRSKHSGDLVARLGGDEFAILLGDIVGRRDAELAAERILALIAEPIEVDGVPLSVTGSLGVAMYPEDASTLSTALHHADLAMYRAKTEHTGYAFYLRGSSTAPGRLSLVSELREAIENDDLRLHYQPKVDMATGAIHTVEALLRWNHPLHGGVSPSWFMPVAEQTDLMRDVSDFVFRTAVAQCAKWRASGIDVGVAVNASARNLHDFRFPRRIHDVLTEFGLPASSLELEITENTIMEEPRRTSVVLEQLRSLGVSVSIDDFGTGYSSLASLRNLTIDSIKIDRSFIVGLNESDADLTIARSVIELGRNLGLRTVAEGVETDEVLRIVRDLGVDEFQGFLASRPMPPEELEPVLIHGRLDMTSFDVSDDEGVGSVSWPKTQRSTTTSRATLVS